MATAATVKSIKNLIPLVGLFLRVLRRGAETVDNDLRSDLLILPLVLEALQLLVSHTEVHVELSMDLPLARITLAELFQLSLSLAGIESDSATDYVVTAC